MANADLSIEAPLDASDDSYFFFSIDTTETRSFNVGTIPSNFGSMTEVEISCERTLVDPQPLSPDSYNISGRVVSGPVLLAAASSAGEFVNLGTPQGTSDFTFVASCAYVNTAASKSTWDTAVLELRQTWTQNGLADGNRIKVDWAKLAVVYNIARTTVAVGTVTETEISQTVGVSTTSGQQTVGVGTASEVEESGSVGIVSPVTVPVVASTEVESVRAAGLRLGLISVAEFESAAAVSSSSVQIVPIGTAHEGGVSAEGLLIDLGGSILLDIAAGRVRMSL